VAHTQPLVARAVQADDPEGGVGPVRGAQIANSPVTVKLTIIRAVTEAIEVHVRRFFRGHSAEFQQWLGPIESRLPGFRVMVLAPGPKTRLWTYVTVGAHAVRREGHGVGFFLLSPEANILHVELVTMVAHYHASSDASYRLGLGHTVPIGRPWLPDSKCDCLLVSAPYPFGPELERCEDAGGHVQLLWLLPITSAERTFKIKHGLEALEQRFEAGALEYWKPDRRSVV
jgi:hypothetical protein